MKLWSVVGAIASVGFIIVGRFGDALDVAATVAAFWLGFHLRGDSK